MILTLCNHLRWCFIVCNFKEDISNYSHLIAVCTIHSNKCRGFHGQLKQIILYKFHGDYFGEKYLSSISIVFLIDNNFDQYLKKKYIYLLVECVLLWVHINLIRETGVDFLFQFLFQLLTGLHAVFSCTQYATDPTLFLLCKLGDLPFFQDALN